MRRKLRKIILVNSIGLLICVVIGGLLYEYASEQFTAVWTDEGELNLLSGIGLEGIQEKNTALNLRRIPDIQISVHKYQNTEGENDVTVEYPQICWLKDKAKEKRINELIKEDILKKIQGDSFVERTLFLGLDYEGLYINNRIVSINYHGQTNNVGAFSSTHLNLSTVIDIEQEKIVNLSDCVMDMETFCTLLLENQFYEVTSWEGQQRDDLISSLYGDDRKRLWEDITRKDAISIQETYTEWYVLGEKFGITMRDGRYYNTVGIELEKLAGVVNLGLLRGEEGKGKSGGGLINWLVHYNDSCGENIITWDLFAIEGLADAAKEEQIGEILRQDIKKVSRALSPDANLVIEMKGETVFINESIISMGFEGSKGSKDEHPDERVPLCIGTTIDLESGQVLFLSDIVSDMDALADLLLNNHYEDMVMWNGQKDTEIFTRLYGQNKEELLQDLNRSDSEDDYSNDYTEWYTDGENLILIMDDGDIYGKVGIPLISLEGIMKESFLIKRS